MAEHPSAASQTAARSAFLISRDGTPPRRILPELLQERVLSVWINGVLALKMVCTPSDLKELILGHLLSEAMISDHTQVRSITIHEETFSATVEVSCQEPLSAQPLEIRACDCGPNGRIGRADIAAWNAASDSGQFQWRSQDIFHLADTFREQTPLYRKTKGIHSCLLMHNGSILYCCEDIGRHNALDKVIGHAVMDGLDLKTCIVYSSGRVPEDMIAKAIRAGIPVLVSKATPTARAVDLARRHHVTLICAAHPDSMKVFSCREQWNLTVSVGILAGGNSSRMGTNKILLESHGETFLEHLQRQCAFLSETIISMRYPDQIPHISSPYVLDEKQNYGPLEGIYQVLRKAKHPYVLILAADMQCLDQTFLQKFLEKLTPEDDCMVLRGSNGLEPLCSVYGKSVLPVLEEMRRQDIRRPRLLFDQVRTHYVTAEDLSLTEEALSRSLSNINTPEDYRTFLKNH